MLSGGDYLIAIKKHKHRRDTINRNTATAQRSTSKQDVITYARDAENARRVGAEKLWLFGKAIEATLKEENTNKVQAQRVKDGEQPVFRAADLARELVAEGIYKNENTAQSRLSQARRYHAKHATLALAIADEANKKKQAEKPAKKQEKNGAKSRSEAEASLKKAGYPAGLRKEILSHIYG